MPAAATPTAWASTPRTGARPPAGDIPTCDWLGRPIDCAACVHRDLRTEGGCEPGHSCMQDAYARRIDRFFRTHRELAAQHLDHPYFEVRAIAARYVDIFRLGPMRQDPDETVRLQVALRVPQRLLAAMCDDPHREVRIRVAQRIDSPGLSRLIQDPDYEVRTVVARRLPVALLPLLAADPDEQVRRVVAERLEMPALWRLAQDPSDRVRRTVAERAPLPLLSDFLTDADWAVRWTVAHRADGRQQRDWLLRLSEDADPEVRAQALERLAEPAAGPPTPLPAGDAHGRHRPG